MLLLDGPMGSELTRRGVDTSMPLWSARALTTAPDTIREIHAAYAAAGATHHRTNTFRARRRTAGDAWESLARRAVALAKETGQVVLGSVGPLEDCYRPDLAPTGDGARREHEELASLLAQEGVDALICETFASPDEALIATRACVRTGKETWVSFTAGPSATLMTPHDMREMAHACLGEGASVVMVNCVSANLTLPYLEALRAEHDRVGVYANASAWNEPPMSTQSYVTHAREWVARADPCVVGACCGVRVDAIKSLTALLEMG
jgi:S-methylmethionine-dependent homocysteine/selenocysteine methylase